MAVRIKHLPGQKIGNLIYLCEIDPYVSPNGKKYRQAIFLCSCGKEFSTLIQSVNSSLTKSCGCLNIKIAKETHTKHGLMNHPIYIIWKGMKQRCSNPNTRNYHRWGGRGIEVCKEWINDFKVFYDWSMSNGWKKGLQIDRINNDGNYYPDNCRFVTHFQNQQNKSNRRGN